MAEAIQPNLKVTMEISCREVWREVSNYLDGMLDYEMRSRLDAHFKQCSHCSAILDGARNVIMLVADEHTFTLPAKFSENLYKKLEEVMKG